MAVGAPAFAAGHNSLAQAIVLDGVNSYVQLPANIAKASAFTFAAWVHWNGGAPWQRIFDFGNDTSNYLFLTPNSGNGTLRFAINNGNGEQILERAGALASGSWQHVAFTLNGNTAILYVNGAPAASSSRFSITPSAFAPVRNYLGKSQFSADPLFSGKLEAVEIADYAMTAAQVSLLYKGQTVATNPASIFYRSGNGNLTLSWPADHTGWRLQAQTNNLARGFGKNWFDVPGSAGTNTMSLPMDLRDGSALYRLIYP
jgi:hypothetical protein